MKKSNRLLALVIMCMAAVWSYADNANRIYFDLVKAAPGMQATLSVAMDNEVDIEGFQFKLNLPDGVSVAKKSNGKFDMALSSRADDQSISGAYKSDGSFQCVATSFSHANFSENTGVIASFVLDIDASVALGDYDLTVSEIQLSTNNTFVYYDLEDYVGTLSIVDRVVGEESYSLSIVPFAFNDDVEVPFVMDNAADIATVEFDVTLPEIITVNELYYIDPVLGKTKFTTGTDVKDDGTVHVSVVRRSSNKIAAGIGTEIATLGLAFDEAVTEGKYTVEVNNIILTDTDGNEHKATSYKSDIYVGTPAVTGKVATFNGDYSDEDAFAMFEASLNSISDAEAIDLREVTALPANVLIPTPQANTLVFTSTDLHLANTDNVVIGRECSNLVITDGNPFSAGKTFTASNASYARTVTADWGTVCLPYAVVSDENVQYYQLKSRTESTLVFTEVSGLEAGQPGVFQKISADGNVAMQGMNVDVAIAVKGDAVRADLTLVGTFSQMRIDVDEAKASYYIKDNAFMKGVEYFIIPAFRAYFESAEAASSKVLNIVVEDESTGISQMIGTFDCTNSNIYSVGGVQVDKAKNGLYIQNGKKYYVK